MPNEIHSKSGRVSYWISKTTSVAATTLSLLPNHVKGEGTKIASFSCSGVSFVFKAYQEIYSQFDKHDYRGWRKTLVNLTNRALLLAFTGIDLFTAESKTTLRLIFIALWAAAVATDFLIASTPDSTDDPHTGRCISGGRTLISDQNEADKRFIYTA